MTKGRRPTIESYLEVAKSLEKQQLDRVKGLKYGAPIKQKNKKLLAKDTACITIIDIDEYMQKVLY